MSLLVTMSLLNGLTLAALLFITASGLTLSFSLMRVVNLTHGAFYMAGGFIGVSVIKVTGSWILAMLAGGGVMAVVALLEEKYLLRWARGNDLIETLISLSVAIIIGDLVLPLIHIETPREFYDYTAKYESDDTQYFCPCGLPEDVEKEMQARSLEAFKALDCSGWGRVDFIMDEAGKAWFLEVNTTPGMTSHSLVPQAAAEIGIGFDELVWRILESSL